MTYNAEQLIAIQEKTGCSLIHAKMIYDDCGESDSDSWRESLAVIQEAELEDAAWQEERERIGDFDPSPEEQAGWAMQDKIDMYRNEY